MTREADARPQPRVDEDREQAGVQGARTRPASSPRDDAPPHETMRPLLATGPETSSPARRAFLRLTGTLAPPPASPQVLDALLAAGGIERSKVYKAKAAYCELHDALGSQLARVVKLEADAAALHGTLEGGVAELEAARRREEPTDAGGRRRARPPEARVRRRGRRG